MCNSSYAHITPPRVTSINQIYTTSHSSSSSLFLFQLFFLTYRYVRALTFSPYILLYPYIIVPLRSVFPRVSTFDPYLFYMCHFVEYSIETHLGSIATTYSQPRSEHYDNQRSYTDTHDTTNTQYIHTIIHSFTHHSTYLRAHNLCPINIFNCKIIHYN